MEELLVENRESVGIDLDGVIYPWIEAVCTYFRLYKKYEGTDYNFIKNLDKYITQEDWNYIVTLQDLYSRFSPGFRLLSFLQRLSEKYNIFYITSRPQETRMVTEKYFRDYKFPQKDNLIFSKDKDTYARLLGLQYFIEDSVSNAEKLNNVCVTFLIKTPYNENYSGNVKMIDNIYQLEGILL